MYDQPTRRRWLRQGLGVALVPGIAEAWQHARQAATSTEPVAPEALDPASASAVEAIVNQIIPSDGSAGAREAGVIHFIDRALATFDSDKKKAYRDGLAEVNRARLELFPKSASVPALETTELHRLIGAIEHTPFFELLRVHTVLGFLGPPSYGGNREGVGWTHIGFENKMTFEPPFGHYDAEARKEGSQ